MKELESQAELGASKGTGEGCTGPRDQAPGPVPHHPLANVITLHIPDSRLEDKYLAQTESGPATSRGDKKGPGTQEQGVWGRDAQGKLSWAGTRDQQLDCHPLMNHRAGLHSHQQGFLFSARFGDT